MTNLVLISGSYSTGAAWRPVIDHLPSDWTIRTATLPGYDGVPDARTRDNCSIETLIPTVIQAVDGLSGPIHLAGHSFGFQPAVAAILNDQVKAASLTSFEGNTLFPVRKAGREDLFAEVCNIRDEFVAAFDADDPDAAGIIIDYWGNAGSWDAMPPHIQDFARAGAAANVLDWIGAVSWEFDIDALSEAVPAISILRGEYSNPVMTTICDTLYDQIPHATLEIVGGANHFLITTHPVECANALLEIVERV